MTFSALPQIGNAVGAWAQTLEFVVVGQEVIDHRVVERFYPRKGRGTRIPLRPQELQAKPEGQRAWRWEQIFTTPSIALDVNDIISFGLPTEGTRYRVMSKADYSQFGFIQYEVVQDYQE